MPPFSHLTYCTPTESTLYLANSLAAALREPALYWLLTFHVPRKYPFSFSCCVMLLLETLHPGEPSGGYFTSGLFCLQRKHLAHEYLLTVFFWVGVTSTSPNPRAEGYPLVGCPRLLIQFIRSYPPYRKSFLYPQPEDAPCCGDRDIKHGKCCVDWFIIMHSTVTYC